MNDHERGCQGREYACTCGYDAERDALIQTLRAAVKFYAEAWCFTTSPKRPGLEWKPKEALLDDCGNVARDALAAAKEQGQ